MPSSPVRYLSAGDVLLIQRDTLEHEGGIEGACDMGLLDAAVATPRQRMCGIELHPGLAVKAAAYLHHIAMNHAFFDGNKRAAAMSALVFLRSNGVSRLPDPDELEATTLGVAAGRISKTELIEWMKEHTR